MDARQLWPRTRWRQVLLVLAVAVFATIFVVAFFLEEPLRRRIEADVNAQLKGYKVSIGRLDLHPIGLSLDLENSVIVQEAHPDPPMAEVPSLSASVHWVAILRGRLVADFRFDEPKLHIDARQGQKELEDETPVAARGWQEAAYEIYPLKINELKVVGGQVTYKPEGDFKPLELSNLNAVATNIRNVRSKDREYPSDLHLDAVVFENATLGIEGNADFLAEPHPGIKTSIDLSKLPLSYLTGVIHEYAQIRKGVLSGTGTIEYAPKIKQVNLENVTVSGADADYVKTASNEAKAKEVKQKTIQEAKKVSNDPGIQLRAKQVRVTESTVGWVDRTAKPDYRVFISGLDVSVKNFSNQKSEGAGTVEAKGQFMGSGPSTLNVTFRPQTKSPDFDLAVGIRDADLKSMNDLLRAKANVDVTQGQMGYFSELKVRNNHMDGYVKVLFSNLDVYDPEQDKEKPFLRKAYEAIADGVAEILENRSTEDTATRASISGPIENPDADIWEIIGNLIRNAFFDAILPGLDRERAKLFEARRGFGGDDDRKKDGDSENDSKNRRKGSSDDGDGSGSDADASDAKKKS